MNYSNYSNYVPFEKMTTQDNKPEWLVVHCSDSDYDNFESIQRYHITDPSRMYENYAYHFGIDKNGKVYIGRPEYYHGAHVSQSDTDGIRMNNKSLGICLFGKFESKMPTIRQIDALQDLLLSLSKKYKISPLKVKPHRHWTGKSKTCYGSAIPDSWASDLLSFAMKKVPNPEPIGTDSKDCSAEIKQDRKTILGKVVAFINTLYN